MKNILTLIVLLQVCVVNAQQGFIKAYDFGYPTALSFNAMVLDGDELVVCGFIKDSLPADTTSFPSPQLGKCFDISNVQSIGLRPVV